jgi:inner membrane protein involved in colicin E2 resistance
MIRVGFKKFTQGYTFKVLLPAMLVLLLLIPLGAFAVLALIMFLTRRLDWYCQELE